MITTSINWPEGLPCPQRSSYSVKGPSPFIRTELQTGRARQRRRFSSTPVNYKMEWLFDRSQVLTFEAWFRDSLVSGTRWFNMTLPNPTDNGLVCRFTGMYDGPDPEGTTYWKVSADIEGYERPLMPEFWGLFPGLIDQADIIDQAVNFEWPSQVP